MKWKHTRSTQVSLTSNKKQQNIENVKIRDLRLLKKCGNKKGHLPLPHVMIQYPHRPFCLTFAITLKYHVSHTLLLVTDHLLVLTLYECKYLWYHFYITLLYVTPASVANILV